MADQGSEAGAFFVRLTASIKEFREGLNSSVGVLKKFAGDVASQASRIASFGKALGTAMLAPARAVSSLASRLISLKTVIVGLIASQAFHFLVTGPAQAAIELERMAARAGIAASQLERLQFVVSAAGGRGDDVSIGIEKLNRIIEEARRGSEEYVKVLRELGFEGLTTSQILARIVENPLLSSGALKKLGISELAVLARLSRKEIEQLEISFVRLGGPVDERMLQLGRRLAMVKTQVKEAFQTIAEQVSQVILPMVLAGAEAFIGWFQTHLPEILAFFETIQEMARRVGERMVELFKDPVEFSLAIQESIEAIFVAIGNTMQEFFRFVVDGGIAAVKALGASIIVLFGPFFTQLWNAAEVQLDFVLDKVKGSISAAFDAVFDLVLRGISQAIVKMVSLLHTAVRSLTDNLPSWLLPDGLLRWERSLGDTVTSLQKVQSAFERAGETPLESLQKVAEAERKAAEERDAKLQSFASEFQDVNREVTKQFVDKAIDAAKEGQRAFVGMIKGVGAAALEALQKVGAAFGLNVVSGSKEFFLEAVERNRISLDKQVKDLKPTTQDTSDLKSQRDDLFDLGLPSKEELKKSFAEARKQSAEATKQASAEAAAQMEQAFTAPLLGAVQTALHALVVEGKSSMEALADVGARLFDEFIGNNFQKLQTALTDTLSQALGASAGAWGQLFGAVLGIAGGVVSVLGKKKSSSKTFNPVQDIVNSTQAVRGVVAGPQNVAIAAVGEELQRALAGTNDILRSQLGVLFDIRRGLKSGPGGADVSFGFAGTVPTS